MSRIIPIFFIIGLGWVLRRVAFLTDEGKRTLDRIVVHIALPATLFLAFIDLKLSPRDLPLVGAALLFCFGLYFVGKIAVRFTPNRERFLPFMMTGLSFGLIGVPLFQTAFGMENLGIFATLGIGHELFMWFFLLPALDAEFGVRRKPLRLFASFLESPIILAVLSGIFLGLLGLGNVLQSNQALSGIREAIRGLSALSMPLVLLSVGYGIRFEKSQLRTAFAYVGLRLAAALAIGFAVKRLFLDALVDRHAGLDHAFFVLTILPPVFSLAIFTAPYADKDKTALINNVVVLYTLAMLGIFSAYVLLTAG